ncbi:hypothetical protein Trydic_g21450 [Trypoxylus dichotomus]
MRPTEIGTLRMIAGKARRDIEKIKNEDINEECGIGEVVKFARKRRQWNDHLQRAEEPRLIRIARDQRPVGRRDPGRSLKRWKENYIST